MDHAEFVTAWRCDAVRVEADPLAAGPFLSARLALPFIAIAVIGSGIALVLWGWIWSGLIMGALGILVPRAIKRTAGGYLLSHIAADPDLYDDALRAGAIRIIARPSQSTTT